MRHHGVAVTVLRGVVDVHGHPGQLFQEELPYHTAVLVQEFKEKTTLIKITADIIVQRDTQKGIILGEGGKMIKQLGTLARKDIEEFLGSKVFLELYVKVRPKWRDTLWPSCSENRHAC